MSQNTPRVRQTNSEHSPDARPGSRRRPAPGTRPLRLRRPVRIRERPRLLGAHDDKPSEALALASALRPETRARVALALATTAAAVLLLPMAAVGTGCSSTSIWARETLLGQAKRDQLVDSVVEARDEQVEAKDTFSSALDELLALSSGSQTTEDLEAQYRVLENAYDRSSGKADRVRSRVNDVERVAEALFREWETELDQYESDSLRRRSADQLEQTREQYDGLIASMRAAAATMDPVLTAFRDQTLFLKHNLNARAIASLQTDLAEIRVDVANLIAEMESAIAEADEFISAVQGG